MTKILFFPVVSTKDLDQLNHDEVLAGYFAGIAGQPEPTHSRSFWHGWRNGMLDSGRMQKDIAQTRLAHEYYAGKLA